MRSIPLGINTSLSSLKVCAKDFAAFAAFAAAKLPAKLPPKRSTEDSDNTEAAKNFILGKASVAAEPVVKTE